MNDNKVLEGLFMEDQSERNVDSIDWDILTQRDADRRIKVEGFIHKEEVVTGADHFHAAMIFQHSGDIDGLTRAKDLANRAIELGDERAKWLYAAATDRLLMFQGLRQKYGTQYVQRYVAGEGSRVLKIYELYPYEEATTDKERLACNVPNIKDAIARAESFLS